MEDIDLQFYVYINLGIVRNVSKCEQENGITPGKLILSMGKIGKMNSSY
jgi:hypothetical protein